MSQPKLKLSAEIEEDGFSVLIDEGDWDSILAATAKTRKTAYKRAAAKLRKLADEAERLGEKKLIPVEES